MINLLPDAALSLSEEQRRKIACTLVMVAASDGALVREEISAIESAMGAMMLHPESREEVRQLLTQPPELDSLLEGMETAAIRLALRDAALLASVDGDYDDAELSALQKISDAAGLRKKSLRNSRLGFRIMEDGSHRPLNYLLQMPGMTRFSDSELEDLPIRFYGCWCELTGIKKNPEFTPTFYY